MKYKISVRQLNSNDASRDCPFPDVDIDVYDLHLRALVDDISGFSGVTDAYLTDGIIVESSLEQSFLQEAIKSLFVREFCYVRFVHIEAVD